MEHQNKINYTNELDRIRGELSKSDTRLPSQTRAVLKRREEELKRFGAQIIDKNN